MNPEARDSREISFRCAHCGAKLTVRQSVAGKQGRCPKCRQRVTVPVEQAGDTADVADVTADKSSPYDAQLLDIPVAKRLPAAPAGPDDPETALRELRKLQGGPLPGHSDERPERKLPWLVDIFLYPANKAGLMVLLICVGVPFLTRLTTRFFFFAMASFGPLFIFWVLFIVLQWAVLAFALLYANWYFCECIRDSAEGSIRAADTTASTPGLLEVFGQAIKVIASVVVCMGPASIYAARTGSSDAALQILFALGGFFIPMAVLAMVIYDAWRALSPFLLLGSILKTPLQYCALVAFGYASCLLVPVTARCLTTPETWIQGFALLTVTLYQLLILAHLLGGFYRRNDEKLNWDA